MLQPIDPQRLCKEKDSMVDAGICLEGKQNRFCGQVKVEDGRGEIM